MSPRRLERRFALVVHPSKRVGKCGRKDALLAQFAKMVFPARNFFRGADYVANTTPPLTAQKPNSAG